MYETAFPINDLLRRKTQTGLVVACLTLCVASTLFLLLFSSRIGVGIASFSEGVLTQGLSAVFSQFILFVGMLVLAVGAVLTSFMVFLMMTQRTRDFGLIKAAGCPNSLVFGFYMTELLILTFVSCTLGVAIGLVADFASAGFSNFAAYRNPPNLWFAPLVFAGFFILALVFGARPLLKAAKLSPVTALSPVQYYGLTAEARAKPFKKSRLTAKMAMRSLFRRKSATVRIVVLLSVVFILLTVSIAGSLIAKETTTSWIAKASGKQVIAITHESMASHYKTLQSAFVGTVESREFDYLNEEIALSEGVVQRLQAVDGIGKLDMRLILKAHLYEVRNFTVDPETLEVFPVGGNREGDALLVGVDAGNVTGNWYTQGLFLQNDDGLSAVIGDSIAQTMFSQPLIQSLRTLNQQFAVVGVCVDPVNNGRIVYVSLKQLQNIAGVSTVNIVFASLENSTDRSNVINQILQILRNTNPSLVAFELDELVETNTNFLEATWSTIMLLPLFTLLSAALCLMAYVLLAIDEQRQEFAFLRAIGAKPKTIVRIVTVQSIIVLLSGYGLGLSFGVMTTLMILMRQPVVTSFTIVQIASWLFAALAGMLILSLVPALKFARAPLLNIMV